MNTMYCIPCIPSVLFFPLMAAPVSQGAEEMFRLLPHKYVTPQDLPALAALGPRGSASSADGWVHVEEWQRCVYGCVVGPQEMVELKVTESHSSSSFDKVLYSALLYGTVLCFTVRYCTVCQSAAQQEVMHRVRGIVVTHAMCTLQ